MKDVHNHKICRDSLCMPLKPNALRIYTSFCLAASHRSSRGQHLRSGAVARSLGRRASDLSRGHEAQRRGKVCVVVGWWRFFCSNTTLVLFLRVLFVGLVPALFSSPTQLKKEYSSSLHCFCKTIFTRRTVGWGMPLARPNTNPNIRWCRIVYCCTYLSLRLPPLLCFAQ